MASAMDDADGELSEGVEDHLQTTVLAVALAALHQVAQEEEHQQRNRTVAAWRLVLREFADDDDFGEDGGGSPRVNLTRRVFPRPDYRDSAWGRMLRDESLSDHTSHSFRKFRRRFRIPYPFFLELVKLLIAKDKRWFPSGEQDLVGRQCIPLELKILGRGNCFDDITQMSLMSESTAAATIHTFCKSFAEELYDEHIHLPTGEYLEHVMNLYHRLGFTGAMGSTDVTHVRWGTCPYTLAHSYTGKEGFPTIAYQATVDHSGRILAVTEGFTGATNDKTIIRYDAAVRLIRQDPAYRDRFFRLWNADGTWTESKGCYLLVDNGYHQWVTLMPPTEYPATRADTAFSKTLESVRKDVECCFGILKGRFRILKLAIQFPKKEDIDNVFFTCCILHNMLHSFDGMDKMEPKEVDWAGKAGQHDAYLNDSTLDFSSVGSSGSIEKVEVEKEHAVLKKKLITSFLHRMDVLHDIEWLSR